MIHINNFEILKSYNLEEIIKILQNLNDLEFVDNEFF